MKSYIFFWLAIFGLCLSVSADPPNFILILTDDQGWSQVSEAMDSAIPDSKSDYLETPNMDRLGRGGIRFSSGYSPAPLCTPTRRSILCGTSTARSGTEFASTWVPANHMTMPAALKQANPAYRCAHFGKWGEQMISTPEECGYDASDGSTGNVDGGMIDKNDEYHIVEDPKRTGTVTGRAVQFMQTQAAAGNPFYLQVSYYAVHLRVELLQAALDKFLAKGVPDRGYTEAWAGMLNELDDGVGRLLDEIDALGITSNTYVVLMADNGGRGTIPYGDDSRPPTNFPLRGAKHSLYEGGVRVPFMIRGPGIAAGAYCKTPVAGYDLLPTFYELAGGTVPLPDEVDGISVTPLLANPSGGSLARTNDALYFHRPGKKFSTIRQGDYKLMVNWTDTGEVSSRELYCLEPDPRELIDLSSSNAVKVAEMENILTNYLASVNAKVRGKLQLNVIGGTGSGAYLSGTNVAIQATPPPHNWQGFDVWSGNTATVADINAASTTVLVTEDVSVTAEVADLHTQSFHIPYRWLENNGFDIVLNDPEMLIGTDPDNDRQLTWMEYLFNTDPHDINSAFRIMPRRTNHLFGVAFETATNLNYRMEYTDDLSNGTWITFTNLQGTGEALEILDQGFASNRYYKVGVDSKISVTHTAGSASTLNVDIIIRESGSASATSDHFIVTGFVTDSGSFGKTVGLAFDGMSATDTNATTRGDKLVDGTISNGTFGMGVVGGLNAGMGPGSSGEREGIAIALNVSDIDPSSTIQISELYVQNVFNTGESFVVVNLITRDFLEFGSGPAGNFDVSSLNLIQTGGSPSIPVAAIYSGKIGGFRLEGVSLKANPTL
ncbi:MAG: sulfatase-like hydrolase/transferase [Kiritimatiellales bacterium]|nr:sulfatase-like hydrolase/transferase [Kiritimatiellales bacterium]